MRLIFVLLAFLLGATSLGAGQCAPVTYGHQHKPTFFLPFYQQDFAPFGFPVVSFQFYAPNVQVIQQTGVIAGGGIAPQTSYGQSGQPTQSQGPDFPMALGQPGQASYNGGVGSHAGVLKQHCASCHSGGQGKGGVTLFDASGNFAPNVSMDKVYEVMEPDSPKPMPPSGQRVPRDQRLLVLKAISQK